MILYNLVCKIGGYWEKIKIIKRKKVLFFVIIFCFYLFNVLII